jgi:Cu(I)/Ag(I) efflux system membrane fusion protein
MKKLFFLFALTISIGILFIACNNSKTEPLAADETYTCEMHNQVMSDHPGKCPVCGMNLTRQKMTEEQKKMKASGNYVKPKE